MSIQLYENNLTKVVADNLEILPELNKEQLEKLSFIFLMNFENLAPMLMKIYMELDDNSKEMLDKYRLEMQKKNLLSLPNSGLSGIQNGGMHQGDGTRYQPYDLADPRLLDDNLLHGRYPVRYPTRFHLAPPRDNSQPDGMTSLFILFSVVVIAFRLYSM